MAASVRPAERHLDTRCKSNATGGCYLGRRTNPFGCERRLRCRGPRSAPDCAVQEGWTSTEGGPERRHVLLQVDRDGGDQTGCEVGDRNASHFGTSGERAWDQRSRHCRGSATLSWVERWRAWHGRRGCEGADQQVRGTATERAGGLALWIQEPQEERQLGSSDHLGCSNGSV